MSGPDATNTDNTQALTPGQQLSQMIEQMEQDGVTLELIVAMVMSNPEGTGAMDICSDNIAGITDQSNVLSKVQADVISLNSILSKIESQLGTASKITSAMWKNSGVSKLLGSLAQAYNKLSVDLKSLAALKSQNLSAVVKGISVFKDDFSEKCTGTNPLNSKQGVSFTLSQVFKNWNPDNTSFSPSTGLTDLPGDIIWLAEQHYDANHGSGTSSTTTDYLANWWSDGNAAQSLCSGQSQQDTTEVQSLMQLLQGFDSTAQQDIQLASSQKSVIIRNQMAS